MSIVNANTGITLRTEKGSALTFNEMDQNFSSFFYSASVASSGGTNRLRLFYTGSTDLDNPGFTPDRYMEVLLPSSQGGTTTVTQTLSVPGNDSNILFSKNKALAAAGSFVFEENTARVGIGVVKPDAPLTVSSMQKDTASTVTIRANSDDDGKYSRGYFEIKRDGNPLMMLGKLGNGDNKPTRLYSKENIEIGITDFCNSGGTISGNSVMKITNDGTILGDKIASSSPASRLSVIGEFSIGNSNTNTALNYIGVNTVGASLLPSPPQGTTANTQGLLIQSPKATTGGHVTIGINAGSSQCESFTIASGCEGTFDSAIATFKADGDVGIGQRNPQAKLHVEGNISGSGTLDIYGKITGRDCLNIHEHADFRKTINVFGGAALLEGLTSYNTSVFDTNNKTTPVQFRRHSYDDSQKLSIGVGDSQAIFDYEEDTDCEGKGTFGSYKFILSGNNGTDKTACTNSVACTPLTITKEGLTVNGAITTTGPIYAECFIPANATFPSDKVLKTDGTTETIGGDTSGNIITNELKACKCGHYNTGGMVDGRACKYLYQKLSTGFIIQGGQFKTGTSDNTKTKIHFPVAFPKCAMAVNITSIRDGSSGFGSNYVFDVGKSSFCVINHASCGYFIAIGF